MSFLPDPPPALPRSASARAPEGRELAEALTKTFETPLRAMRATLEELGRSLAPQDPRLPTLSGLLEEVRRLALSVQELVDYTTLPAPRNVRCSLAEIGASVRAAMPTRERLRLLIACDAPDDELALDAIVLGRALAHLTMNALEATANPVLLSLRAVHASPQPVVQCTVADASPAAPFRVAGARAPFTSQKPNHLGLGLVLATRDIASLGGTLESVPATTATTLVVARIPARMISAEELAA